MKSLVKFSALVGTVVILVLAGCGTPGLDDQNSVRVTVSTDYAAAVPGQSITLVWRFEIAPEWHLYWPGRNDSGFAPTIDLNLPPGWIAGGLQWPAPQRHLSEGDILDHVYYRELVLLQKIGVPAEALPTGSVAVSGEVRWLACKDACVPGKTLVPLEIALTDHVAGRRSATYTKAHEMLPRPLPTELLGTRWEGQTFHVRGPAGARLQFMPTVDCGELVNLIRDGTGSNLALRFQVEGEIVGPVRGLITIQQEGEPLHAYSAEFPAQRLSAPASGG
jgi:DsbC/DsbD-like thiol-disulfide interchange protein